MNDFSMCLVHKPSWKSVSSHNRSVLSKIKFLLAVYSAKLNVSLSAGLPASPRLSETTEMCVTVASSAPCAHAEELAWRVHKDPIKSNKPGKIMMEAAAALFKQKGLSVVKFRDSWSARRKWSEPIT